MTEYPKVLYKGPQFDDWQELGRKITSREVESVTVQNAEEEAAKVKEGFGHLSKLMEKRPTLTLKQKQA